MHAHTILLELVNYWQKVKMKFKGAHGFAAVFGRQAPGGLASNQARRNFTAADENSTQSGGNQSRNQPPNPRKQWKENFPR